MNDLERKWKTGYKEIRRTYDFLVNDLNFQQQRIANVLITNGLILGFLGASAGVFFDAKVHIWPTSTLYVASMFFLALGVLAAVVALLPKIDPRGGSAPQHDFPAWVKLPTWVAGKSKPKPNPSGGAANTPTKEDKADFILYPRNILSIIDEISEVELLKILSESIVDNAEASDHLGVIEFRRRWIYCQLFFIAIGVVFLIAALIFRLILPPHSVA